MGGITIFEIDHNTGKRAVPLGRKNYRFIESQTGDKSTATVYTLIETAKLNGVDPRAWFSENKHGLSKKVILPLAGGNGAA